VRKNGVIKKQDKTDETLCIPALICDVAAFVRVLILAWHFFPVSDMSQTFQWRYA